MYSKLFIRLYNASRNVTRPLQWKNVLNLIILKAFRPCLVFLTFLLKRLVFLYFQSLKGVDWSRLTTTIRSSRQEVFCKKGALKNFTRFTGKHLCQSLCFNKVAGLWPETFKNIFFYRTPMVVASILLMLEANGLAFFL